MTPNKVSPALLPILVAVLSTLFSVALFVALLKNERDGIQLRTNQEAQFVKKQIRLILHERVEAIERLVNRWQFTGESYSEKTWANDVARFHANFEGLEASAWIDESGTVRWIFPQRLRAKMLGLSLKSDPVRLKAFDTARDTKMNTLLRVFKLENGSSGFGTFTPIFIKEKFEGAFATTFNPITFFREVLLGSGYGIAVSNKNVELFKSADANLTAPPEGRASTEYTEGDIFWKIDVYASPQILAVEKTLLPPIAFVGAMLVSGLLTLTVHLYLLNRNARKRALYDLMRQNAIASGTKFGIIVTDQDGLVRSLNPGATAILGYSNEEASGRLHSQDWHEREQLQQRTQQFEDVYGSASKSPMDIFVGRSDSRHASDNDWTIVTKDGERKTVSLAVDRLKSPAGDSFGYVAIMEDVTEKLAQQRQLQSHQGALVQSAKFAALGEMAAGVAHEINNPLAIISGKVYFLQTAIANGSASFPAINQELEKIDSTVGRIAKIVAGLRNFSRDPSVDPFRPIQVNDLIDSTTTLCAERFAAQGISLTVRRCDETLWVNSRSYQLSQVLLNLLGNAFDATVNVPSKSVQIEVERRDRGVSISVIDSGSGVPIAIREKIMDPFFTTKAPGKGTGLGLSISQSIIRDHSGSLIFEAQNVGSRFEIWLPESVKGATLVSGPLPV